MQEADTSEADVTARRWCFAATMLHLSWAAGLLCSCCLQGGLLWSAGSRTKMRPGWAAALSSQASSMCLSHSCTLCCCCCCLQEPELELPAAPQQDAEEELGLPAVAQKT
jgi:hypothetical protein